MHLTARSFTLLPAALAAIAMAHVQGCVQASEDTGTTALDQNSHNDPRPELLDRAALDQATEATNHGTMVNGRNTVWKEGNWSADDSEEQTVCTYGWCGFFSIGDCSLSDGDDAENYRYGACNSTAWGERFAGNLWNGGENTEYDTKVSGTTTFGYHPYWCVKYDGQMRTYQGWSYRDSCRRVPRVSYEVEALPPPPPPPPEEQN